ncbi:MAG: hypothetical protein DMD51_08120 [Gemmatimonadetes bacterium]|nr:MAG: hypothetical protein DMD51_08120 [Gemmatimonadota bacterium]
MSRMHSVRLLTALLQLSLPGAAAWADARLDSAGAHATAHVESHTTSACARIHPPDCALCHFLSAPFAGRRAAALRLATSGARTPRPVEPAPVRNALARFFPPPRAPPVLS